MSCVLPLDKETSPLHVGDRCSLLGVAVLILILILFSVLTVGLDICLANKLCWFQPVWWWRKPQVVKTAGGASAGLARVIEASVV